MPLQRSAGGLQGGEGEEFTDNFTDFTVRNTKVSAQPAVNSRNTAETATVPRSLLVLSDPLIQKSPFSIHAAELSHDHLSSPLLEAARHWTTSKTSNCSCSLASTSSAARTRLSACCIQFSGCASFSLTSSPRWSTSTAHSLRRRSSSPPPLRRPVTPRAWSSASLRPLPPVLPRPLRRPTRASPAPSLPVFCRSSRRSPVARPRSSRPTLPDDRHARPDQHLRLRGAATADGLEPATGRLPGAGRRATDRLGAGAVVAVADRL